ncbi:MAG TPA: DUF1549 domain-containing protein [Pirellulales bacterium]|nr:DUF1549 domain-containing protein [Pirellulales bacterium]
MGRIAASVSAIILLIFAVHVLPAEENSSPPLSRPASMTASTTSSSSAGSISSGTNSATSKTVAAEQVRYINDYIHQGWQAHNLLPSQTATDGEWCRRLFLDLLGRIPDVDEVEGYLRDHSPDKKQHLVNKLLSEDYVEEYANNWANVWTTILIGRPPAQPDRRSLVDREGMQKYLRDTFARNKPYDQMVTDLLTADGSNKPGEENFHGAVNFLIGNMEDSGVNATAKTAKVFLGLQVQCTQCHNHPFNDWKQNQFWELNAFFRQTKAVREGPRRTPEPVAELINSDFNGDPGAPSPAQALLFYELRNGQLKSAYPVFVDGTEINPDGRVSKVNRREELAKLVKSSPYMDQAIVNRMWGHFLGYGFTKPVDDMGPQNPASHPELLEKLAKDFGAHSHDLKQLIRWIVLSEPYGLSSKMMKGHNDKDDPTKGEKPMFSHFYLRQMQPEQLYESLLVATAADKTLRNSDEQERTKNQWLRQFTITFGTDDGADSTTFNGTIPQTLMMFNGDLIRRATNTGQGDFLDQLANDAKMNNADRINRLFLATVARRPNPEEISWANKLLTARKGDPVGALQDVFWVTLNSAEFILNH